MSLSATQPVKRSCVVVRDNRIPWKPVVCLQILELHERPAVSLLTDSTPHSAEHTPPPFQARRAGHSPSALGILGLSSATGVTHCGPPSHASQPVDLVQLVSDSKCGTAAVRPGPALAGPAVGSLQKSVLMPLSMWTCAFRRRRKACISESPESLYLRKTSGKSLVSLYIPIAPPANPSNTDRCGTSQLE